MSKENSSKKNVKKEAIMNLKEKRAAKAAKRKEKSKETDYHDLN